MYEEIDCFIGRLIMMSEPDAPLWNIEKIRQGKPAHWNYVDGCMITAVLALGNITEDVKYFDFADRFIDYYVRDDGSILGYDKLKYSVDDLSEGRVLFELYRRTGKEKYRLAIETLYEQVREQPRTGTGNFWHKNIYPNQIWLDGIYMAQFFSALYAREFLNGDYADILRQIRTAETYMKDGRTGLYYHGMDCAKSAFWADRETGCSKSFWLRSIGWFGVALIDIIEIADGPAKEELSGIFLRLMESVIEFRDEESGMYWQVVDMPGREGNYLETSGSAMLAYAMLKGARLKVLDETYALHGKRTFDGICEKYLRTNEEGELSLGGICLVAGLGPENNLRRDGSYEYYVSEPVVENDAKGVAPFLLCYTEVKKLLEHLFEI